MQVPFPAVTIKSSEDLNQWAFPQKALNTLAFDCADGKYPCSQSEHIRNDFKFLIVEVIKQMNKTLEENAQESNISLLEEWKNYYPDYKTKRYKNLHNVVESMAMISLQNKTIGSYMAHDLQEDYIAHFAEFDPIPRQVHWFCTSDIPSQTLDLGWKSKFVESQFSRNAQSIFPISKPNSLPEG